MNNIEVDLVNALCLMVMVQFFTKSKQTSVRKSLSRQARKAGIDWKRFNDLECEAFELAVISYTQYWSMEV